jgi:hypothetical protein
VVYYRGNGTAWLECRLCHAATDELLVTIGVQLVSEQEQWKILTLDWQDSRMVALFVTQSKNTERSWMVFAQSMNDGKQH